MLVRAMIELFRHISGKGESVHLNLDRCEGPIDVIIQAAMALQAISSITIDCPNSDEVSSIISAICWGVKCNPRLTRVQLNDMRMCREQAEALSDGLKAADISHFKSLGMAFVSFADDSTFSELVSGLCENSSLDELMVSCCDIKDTQIFELFDVIESHVSIKKLTFTRAESNSSTEGTARALAKLLAKSKLQHLLLTDLEAADRYGFSGLSSIMGIIAEGLKGNQHLEELNLAFNSLDDEDLRQLTKILWSCPRLKHLDLSCNDISGKGLEIFASQRPSFLRQLELGNSLNLLPKLLQRNPLLVEISNDEDMELRPEVMHWMDFNRSGRILLGQGDTAPISLWPVVLARANNLFREYHQVTDEPRRRRANAIFHLLREDPALLQRRVLDIRKKKPILDESGSQMKMRLRKRRKISYRV